MNMQRDETYSVEAHCANCDRIVHVNIPKGEPIDIVECPNCGCCELHIIRKPQM